MPAPARLQALATAVPAHRFGQDEIRVWAARHFTGCARDIERLLPAFDNAGIESRYSCMPLEWFAKPRGWEEKNRLYLDHAVDLLCRAAKDCLDQARLNPGQIDAIVSVSTSGIATPSLDVLVMQRLGLRPDAMRLPVFGLGCAGGVLGLARAAEMARAMPGQRILFLVVELCSLTFRANDLSKSNIIATVLFGDGAAAAILNSEGDGPAVSRPGEHTWPDTLDVMGWRILDDGFGVLFSQDIPLIVRRDLPAALDAYCRTHSLSRAEFDGFICHPGGAKVISALEEVFGVAPGGLIHARSVLRDFGNMSAATVMFVLERALAADASGRHLMSALGPGFTAGFLTLGMAH
ncbi:MAG: type III polyketide synthase [Proteobacteria bacterium]|nr:type III polyketide synthase [Pseudomonadota bacterium]